MAKQSSIVGREASPPCTVVKSSCLQPGIEPIHAPDNKYPGGRVNTEPGTKGYQVMSEGLEGLPDHVTPKGATL